MYWNCFINISQHITSKNNMIQDNNMLIGFKNDSEESKKDAEVTAIYRSFITHAVKLMTAQPM